ncbi:immunoglobulin I-set domain protein [Trichuris suis]|nr:immunoglobulin I-set domain protein [Trichuris suis]
MLGQLTADVDSKMEVLHSGKMRRFYSSKLPTLVPLPCQEDKRHAPIFERRLKTVILPLFESDITFECKCIANPPAELTWYHNDTVVENIDRNVILINENQTEKLIIKKAAAGDVGVYKCVAENELGHASCSARLILGDLPDRPSRPDIQLASDTEVFIVWDSPAYTGGSESLYYKLEYRRAGN